MPLSSMYATTSSASRTCLRLIAPYRQKLYFFALGWASRRHEGLSVVAHRRGPLCSVGLKKGGRQRLDVSARAKPVSQCPRREVCPSTMSTQVHAAKANRCLSRSHSDGFVPRTKTRHRGCVRGGSRLGHIHADVLEAHRLTLHQVPPHLHGLPRTNEDGGTLQGLARQLRRQVDSLRNLARQRCPAVSGERPECR